MPVGYIFDIEFSWGFQTRIAGLSKTSPSFYYPPPTTILGAISESIAKEYNIGELKGKEILVKLSENLLAIGLRPINCTPIKYEDLNRIISVKVTSGTLYPDPKNLTKSFDSPAVGKTIFSVFDNNAPTLRIFLVLKSQELSLGGKNIVFKSDFLWGIHRIGSKEGVVSVSNVEYLSKVDIIKGDIETNYSFPRLHNLKLLKDIVKRWDLENYINPFSIKTHIPIKDYSLGENFTDYMIPIKVSAYSDPLYYVAVNGGVACYSFGDERVIGRWFE